jgi:lactase-phlorizin hydrolase
VLGKVGLTLNTEWGVPKSKYSADDRKAAEIKMQFMVGWFAEPVFGSGDYPDVMKSLIGQRSKDENLTESRLPEFTEVEKDWIKGKTV